MYAAAYGQYFTVGQKPCVWQSSSGSSGAETAHESHGKARILNELCGQSVMTAWSLQPVKAVCGAAHWIQHTLGALSPSLSDTCMSCWRTTRIYRDPPDVRQAASVVAEEHRSSLLPVLWFSQLLTDGSTESWSTGSPALGWEGRSTCSCSLSRLHRINNCQESYECSKKRLDEQVCTAVDDKPRGFHSAETAPTQLSTRLHVQSTRSHPDFKVTSLSRNS